MGEPDSDSPRSGAKKGRARWVAVQKTMGPQTMGPQNPHGTLAYANKGKTSGKAYGEGKAGSYQSQTRASSSSEMPGPHSSPTWHYGQGAWQRTGQWDAQDRWRARDGW